MQRNDLSSENTADEEEYLMKEKEEPKELGPETKDMNELIINHHFMKSLSRNSRPISPKIGQKEELSIKDDRKMTESCLEYDDENHGHLNQ